ncbi:uncharacterized protein LOC121878026 [Homarus americanus]|uniref:uncharacterized protein LOC121878026 n=1 Tax=Homarus americanus TaxID=6706 RepID=UPI001C448CF0|nr:uncharacterized protein LOC121878026 [Homarus americanus]
MTPTGMYYTASGDVSSQVSGTESVVAALTLSAGAGPDASYLLSWDFDLQQPLSSDYRSGGAGGGVDGGGGCLLLNLETLLRTNTPPTGEVKLNIKVKRTLQPPPEGDHQVTSYTSDVTTTDIRLITETVPELGRVHGILTRSVDTYSLNGRMWSGQRAVGVESYGVARNDSLKSSHLLTLVDPSFPWARLKLALDTDHIGTFPDNFQTSLSSKVSVGLVEEAGQVRALVQWTPATSAFNLALATYLTTLPGGNIFLKWSDGTVQGHVAWALIKGVAGVQWREGGRALEVALNYHNPGATLHHIDSTMTFTISQAPYPPVSLVLVGRVSINTHHHYVLNVDCRSEQDQYLVTGALVRPGASGSLRCSYDRAGDTYGFLGVIVLDGFSLQVTGAFTAVDAGEEVSVTLNSSLLKDPRGYSIRVYRKKESGKMEIAAFYSQGGGSPNWFYSYRLLTEIQRDIKQKVRYLKAEDRFTYHLLQQILYDYTFVVVIVHNSFDEVELEAEFPDLWPEVKVTGTVVKG